MKKLVIAALLAAQVAPAAAADLAPSAETETGAFAGFRLRVPLDGDAARRGVRAGLTVAPAVRIRDLQGEVRTRIGEGVELGIASREPVQLSVGGVPVARFGPGPRAPEGQKAGVSTVGWVAIGVGVAIVVGGVIFIDWLGDQSE